MHVIAAKAVAFHEAMKPEFKKYQQQLAVNSKELALALEKKGFRIVSGGTDTHLMLVDLNAKGVSGAEASKILGEVNITVNKNLIPFDEKSPLVTSGIRLGTAAISTRNMKEPQMQEIASLINEALEGRNDPAKLAETKKGTIALARKFPLYPELLKEY
jgi:glycine hydroxymethyltransferase